jgi:hypothetical protein
MATMILKKLIIPERGQQERVIEERMPLLALQTSKIKRGDEVRAHAMSAKRRRRKRRRKRRRRMKPKKRSRRRRIEEAEVGGYHLEEGGGGGKTVTTALTL